MADSSGLNGLPDFIATAQAQKEVTANAFLDAASPAQFLGRRALTSTGLQWGFHGGKYLVGGTVTARTTSAISLTASATNRVEFDPLTGGVTANTTGFTAGRVPLYTVVTGASTVTSWTDLRTWGAPQFAPLLSMSVAGGANVTLTEVQARADVLEFTGALTANIAVIVPNTWPLKAVRNLTTGAFALTVRTAAGLGVIAPRRKSVNVYANGTDVIPQNAGEFYQALAYAATLGTIDAHFGERILVGTLTGNATVPAPTNPEPGQVLEFAFRQDATGGRVLTWNAAFVKAADGAGTGNQRASTRYLYDGAAWIQQGGAMTWLT